MSEYAKQIDYGARAIGWFALAIVLTAPSLRRPDGIPWHQDPAFKHPAFWIAMVCVVMDVVKMFR